MRKYFEKKGYQCAISIVLVGAVALSGVNTFAGSNLIATLSGNAVISGDAELSGNAMVSGDAEDKTCSSPGSSYTDSALKMEDIILETLDDAKKDAISRPSGAKYAFVGNASQSEWVLGTHNFSQSWLNDQYYEKYRVDIDGSCSEVATTILSEYYNRKERCVISSDRKGYESTWFPMFDNYMTVAFGLNIYSTSRGTDSGRIYMLFEPFYNMYNKPMEGKKYTSNLSDNIESLHKKAIPVVGSFEAPNGDRHSMVIAGYYDITVIYRTGNNTNYTSTTYRYYTVNNGWKYSCHGNWRIQYIRRSYQVYQITQLKSR